MRPVFVGQRNLAFKNLSACFIGKTGDPELGAPNCGNAGRSLYFETTAGRRKFADLVLDLAFRDIEANVAPLGERYEFVVLQANLAMLANQHP